MSSVQRASQHSTPPSVSEGADTPSASSLSSYTVKAGDTLSKLAARLQQEGVPGSRQELLRQILLLNPQIKNPDLIHTGETLQLPGLLRAPARQEEGGGNRVESFSGFVSRASSRPASEARVCRDEPSLKAGTLAFSGSAPARRASSHTFLRPDGKPFPVSKDGTPRYNQGDADWKKLHLGSGAEPKSIQRSGCAMTSVAMALSRISGETVTPKVLDAHLDTHSGYVGNGIKWGVAAEATGMPIRSMKSVVWNLEKINASLEAGRPVVLGVDYKAGASGGSLGTDHWVCLTRREAGPPERYYANDPAGGGEVCFIKDARGGLTELQRPGAERAPYKSSGEFVTFTPRASA